MGLLLQGRRPTSDSRTLDLLKYSLLFTFGLGLLAHAFAFFNLNPSHDTLFDLFSNISSHEVQISLGRVFEPIYHKLTNSSVVLPWSVGMVSLLWIGLSVFLTAQIFGLTGKLELLAVAGIFTLNRTVISLVSTYLPWLGPDAAALVAAVAAVFCWYRFTVDKNILLLGAGALFVTLSLGLYQAFLSVIITLIMLRSILSLFQQERWDTILKNGLLSIGMIGAGAAVYLVCVQIVCRVTGVALLEGSYNSISNLWSNPEPLPNRLAACYLGVADKFLVDTASSYPSRLVALVNGLLFLFSAVAALLLIRRKKYRGGALALLLVLTAALPFGANFTRFLSPDVHDLMRFALWLLYLVPVLALHQLRADGPPASPGFPRLARGLTCLMALFLLYNGIQTANLVYFKKEMQYTATLSLMTNVMHDIEQQEGYVDGETLVTFVGTPSAFLLDPAGTDRVREITGVYLSSPISYDYSSYFRNVLLRNTRAQLVQELDNETVQQMPVYPQDGYVATVDGMVVVKFQ